MKADFPKFEESGLDRQTWLEAWTLHLESALSSARAAARIMKPERYAAMAEAARGCGYALAVHGSLARDVDLVAVPWTEAAGTPTQVAEALAAVLAEVGGIISSGYTGKPHGRVSVVILAGGGYVDLAVMPRARAWHGGM